MQNQPMLDVTFPIPHPANPDPIGVVGQIRIDSDSSRFSGAIVTMRFNGEGNTTYFGISGSDLAVIWLYGGNVA